MKTLFLGLVDYKNSWESMKNFTKQRLGNEQEDEIWLCQHHSVYTYGLSCTNQLSVNSLAYPSVYTDRGGQITFHGPGQVVAYPLLNIRRRGYFIKEYVYRLEESVISALNYLGITGHRVKGTPGVFIRVSAPHSHAVLLENEYWVNHKLELSQLAKIAFLGVKISHGFSYHGLSWNISMNLEPFKMIDPCGLAGLEVLDLRSLGIEISPEEASILLAHKLTQYL